MALVRAVPASRECLGIDNAISRGANTRAARARARVVSRNILAIAQARWCSLARRMKNPNSPHY